MLDRDSVGATIRGISDRAGEDREEDSRLRGVRADIRMRQAGLRFEYKNATRNATWTSR